jgi:uncharacterized protein (DUF983 family)
MDIFPTDDRSPFSPGEPPALDASGGPAQAEQRPLLTALRRGLARLCPNCGRGHLFDGYLRVRPVCDSCGSNNDRYPADDAPPYVTILLVGHIVVAPMLLLEVVRTWPLWLSLSIFPTLVVAVTLALLPFVKGGVIGACWSLDIVRDPRDRSA